MSDEPTILYVTSSENPQVQGSKVYTISNADGSEVALVEVDPGGTVTVDQPQLVALLQSLGI